MRDGPGRTGNICVDRMSASSSTRRGKQGIGNSGYGSSPTRSRRGSSGRWLEEEKNEKRADCLRDDHRSLKIAQDCANRNGGVCGVATPLCHPLENYLNLQFNYSSASCSTPPEPACRSPAAASPPDLGRVQCQNIHPSLYLLDKYSRHIQQNSSQWMGERKCSI